MKCLNPITIGKEKGKGVHVACGRCMPCQRNKRRDWSFRLQEEQKASTNSLFVTLTYREEEMLIAGEHPTLSKHHLQQFLNKLRKYQDRFWEKRFKEVPSSSFTEEYIKSKYRIRYYAVGEYGVKGDRPHYHIILFDLAPAMWDKLNEIWSKGFVHIGKVNDKSIKYTTKYIIGNEGPGPAGSRSDEPKKAQGMQKPFSLKSNRPGIGESYLTKNIIKYHKKKYEETVKKKKDDVPVVQSREGYFQKMPDYYKNKIFNSDAQKHFKEVSVRLGDQITEEAWERAYKVYGKKAESKLIEHFEHLNQRLKRNIKNSKSL